MVHSRLFKIQRQVDFVCFYILVLRSRLASSVPWGSIFVSCQRHKVSKLPVLSRFVQAILLFVVAFASDFSRLLCVISRIHTRCPVEFGTIVKYVEGYFCRLACNNQAGSCLYSPLILKLTLKQTAPS